MLRFRGELPFDESLYAMTVTVYHREGLTRQVMEGVHFEFTRQETVHQGVAEDTTAFLLVVPYHCAIAPGDKVVPGVGGEVSSWDALAAPVVQSVKPRYFLGRYSHTEARG